MPPIGDYAVPVNTHTGAFVTNEVSIEWLSLPHVDSAACFAALLSNEEQGRWRTAPSAQVRAARRRYRGDTLTLERACTWTSEFASTTVGLVRGFVTSMEPRQRPTRDDGFAVLADFFVAAGELIPFVVSRHPSREPAPAPIDPLRTLADTQSYWTRRRIEMNGRNEILECLRLPRHTEAE